ncbi:hypothetical protein XGA_3631, partial [Xanthomonas hortorum ATCC 19865]
MRLSIVAGRTQRHRDTSTRAAQAIANDLAQALGRRFQFLQRAGAQQHHEFFAAEAEHLMRIAYLVTQDGGQIRECRIACGMPVQIVDLLEMVQIQNDQAVEPIMRLPLIDLMGERAFEHASVGQASERIQ